jgi:hypothetical protein
MKRGATSQDHWFYIPTAASYALASTGHLSLEKVQRRLDLMLCWWKHRGNAQFVQHDSGRMLEAIHECGEMDLTSERGRLDELRSFWLLAFICAHHPWAWDVRDHWEHALLKWRVSHYYCHEHHFYTVVNANWGLCPVKEVVDPADVDLIVTESYLRRFPGSRLPDNWTSVPFSSMPPSAMASSHWEVRDGSVCITYRDFVPWAWHQMVRATDEFNRRILVARWDDQLGCDRLSLDQDMREFLVPFLSQCQRIKEEEHAAVMRAQARHTDAGLPPVTTTEELLHAVKTRFPLCMMQHFWRAFAKGEHPKHYSRVALAQFLLEAGYNVVQVDVIMSGLFSLDKEFMRRYPGGSWDERAYKKKFGVQVASMKRKALANESVKAYACGTLIRAGINDEAKGCPFFKTAPGARKDLATMLDWAGVSVPDIEDIAGDKHVGDPAERCQCDFLKRSALRDVPYFVVRHPNSYMRGFNKYVASTAAGRPKEEIE